jgi:hypothetical protein
MRFQPVDKAGPFVMPDTLCNVQAMLFQGFKIHGGAGGGQPPL